jgi:ribosomal protein L12E/L44/L45/RPP1/RPP2
LFSYALLEAGKNAHIEKTDVKDVFRNVPANIDELRLQDFKVEDRFFIE